jgi:hypothetical protein
VDRVAGVGLGTEIAVLNLEVVPEIVYVDITDDHQTFGYILQPRHPQPEVPLGVGDGQLFPGLLLAILGDIFARERVAMFALEGAEELEGSAPPRALAVGASFIGLRRCDAQDARKFALVIVLHRAWIRLPTHALPCDANANRRPVCSDRGRNSRIVRFGCATQ